MTLRRMVVQPNHTTRVPKRVICIDTESYQTVRGEDESTTAHSWRCGAATFDLLRSGISEQTRSFVTERQEEFWTWVLSHVHKREKLWIFAHNLIYDLVISDFWDLARQREMKITSWLINDPPTIVRAEYKGCKIVLACTLNFWRGNLRTMAEAVEIPKLQIPGELDTNSYWMEYCLNDVMIVRRFILQWIQVVSRLDLGNFRATIAGQAMSSYRHAFMPYRIVGHDDDELAKLEREAYFGGRVMTGFVGKADGPIHHLDVNSLYPYCMHQREFPCDLMHRKDWILTGELLRLTEHNFCLAKVSLNADTHCYPYRHEKGVVYAKGKFTTVLCGEELNRALRHSEVRSIGMCGVYKRRPLFVQWCDFWLGKAWDAKKLGDLFGSAMCKNICNALSGKWAQRPFQWLEVKGVRAEEQYKHWWFKERSAEKYIELRSVAGCVQGKFETDEVTGGLVAISAGITSAGRVHMDNIRERLVLGRCYYQDTDSLFVDDDAKAILAADGLISQTHIGCLKEVDTYKTLIIDGPKRYRHDGVLTTPGLSKKAEEISDGLYIQESFQGGPSVLARDPSGIVNVEQHWVRLTPPPPACHVRSDGFTEPLELDL